MSKTYCEYFEDANTTYLFKYDGAREQRLYTILIGTSRDIDRTLRTDTDQPYEAYMEFLNRKNIAVSDCKIFDLFKKSADRLVKTFGKRVIFLLTMRMEMDEVNFGVCIFGKGCDGYDFEASNLEAVGSYLDALCN